ncbi:MaoC/PaaZ C-terminal domain-containing protein [Nocardia carnea]|uniref:MaoC/PaaZ C-terminal domain-containing protein n=1 Tax=Nocardia carnea TaxID=37328 RepID=UPI0024568415|nr:MaoC/PaaZ C-terminal domain-containing protein [Nocardia carnea]
MSAVADLAGYDLGSRQISYTERDAILYALCVGAAPDDLDLVYERDLHVLPTFALGLGLWAVEAAGGLGAYDRLRSLHAAQTLTVYGSLPRSGTLDTRARIAEVWDKGSAAMMNIVVESAELTATYSIFLPGSGGWGGQRGPSAARRSLDAPDHNEQIGIDPRLPALYRLTGDLHPVHIDPAVAANYGFERPILHGLCTLGIAARALAAAVGAPAWELRELRARFAAPVLPGSSFDLRAETAGRDVDFEAHAAESAVLSGGFARY